MADQAQRESNWDRATALREMLGYLNFSQGRSDAKFQRDVNEYYRVATTTSPWQELRRELDQTLALVRGTTAAFRDVSQAQAVIGLVFDRVLPAYRRHHADLLAHLSDADLFAPFFLARVFEGVLTEGGPWDDADRIVRGTLERLNDFVGYRPVALLERQKCEPYEHERVRPIPLFIRGAGVAAGRYHKLIDRALLVLANAERSVLAAADFDPELLDELALDPRAYDFGHPVNQRPNYHFGEWDPHAMDNQGRYRRFVVRQVLLDALLERVQSGESRVESQKSAELLIEAAAVLAGTILMAAGTSGSGPDAHDSSVTLATLVPKIARYRDAFYTSLLAGVPAISPDHAERLRREAATLHQPFGGARQHLNATLARRRAEQLQAVELARLFARMGYSNESLEQARRVQTPAARIHCEMECRITAANQQLDRNDLSSAIAEAEPLDNLLRRGVACGAIVDPWNILGFQGQFSIFPALENSVPDPRVEQLTRMMEQLFELHGRLLAHAAAAGAEQVEREWTKRFRQLATWWDRFATVEVGGVRRVHGQESLGAARHVARALAAWRGAGAASGDVKFWRQHAEHLRTPAAHARVVNALVEKHDLVASMAIMISWLSRVAEVPLEDSDHAFHDLARTWLESALSQPALVQKFFDYLEANAEDYWEVPGLALGQDALDERSESPTDIESNAESDEVYSAAYDGVTFRDSAADGHEGELLEGGPAERDFALEAAAERIEPRLRFLASLASLWEFAAESAPAEPEAGTRVKHPEQSISGGQPDRVRAWLVQLQRNQRGLERLLDDVHQTAIPQPLGSHESLVEFDRRRTIKEQLTNAVIAAHVVTTVAAQRLAALVPSPPAADDSPKWQQQAIDFDRTMRRGLAVELRARLPALLEILGEQPLLYRRLDRGGHPREIAAARCVQQVLHSLVESLPRAGLVREAYHVLRTAQTMEQKQPVRGEGVTEFDQLFRAGLRAAVESVLESAAAWPPDEQADEPLLECLELLVEPFLKIWIEHSQSLRLATLERIGGDVEWDRLRQFIEQYGHDLLTPKFLTLGNLRAVLDQGVARYFEYLENDRDPLNPVRLLDDLDRTIRRDEAIRLLEIVVQVFVESYEEYRDYNTTTAQSDYGERFFILFELLRIKARYDRATWHLQPFAIVHEQLVRAGRSDAARAWEEAFGQRTAEVADQLLRQLAELERQFGVRLATVRDRLAERFTKPLALDRLRRSVEPAMSERANGGNDLAKSGFARFQRELEHFAATTSGAGLDLPRWLRVLAHEVERVRTERRRLARTPAATRPRVFMSVAELEKQLENWDAPITG